MNGNTIPYQLVCLFAEMELQNILSGTSLPPDKAEKMLQFTFETDWGKSPGFLWNNYYEDFFSPMPPSSIAAKLVGRPLRLKVEFPRWPSETRLDFFPMNFTKQDFEPVPIQTTVAAAVPTSRSVSIPLKAIKTVEAKTKNEDNRG
ncbi:unnamed protein product [Agarophyton chilense]